MARRLQQALAVEGLGRGAGALGGKGGSPGLITALALEETTRLRAGGERQGCSRGPGTKALPASRCPSRPQHEVRAAAGKPQGVLPRGPSPLALPQLRPAAGGGGLLGRQGGSLRVAPGPQGLSAVDIQQRVPGPGPAGCRGALVSCSSCLLLFRCFCVQSVPAGRVRSVYQFWMFFVVSENGSINFISMGAPACLCPGGEAVPSLWLPLRLGQRLRRVSVCTAGSLQCLRVRCTAPSPGARAGSGSGSGCGWTARRSRCPGRGEAEPGAGRGGAAQPWL